MSKISFIVAKEWRHIIRDPKSLVIAVVMPLLMTLLYGYAVNLDTQNIQLAVVDADHSALSRELAGSFYRSGYFTRSSAESNLADLERVLRREQAHAVLVIRPGFSSAVQTGSPYQVGLVVDGADANRAAAAVNYASAIVVDFLRREVPTGMAGINSAAVTGLPGPRIEISRRVLYNPDLESPDFFVPGLIAVILMMISALLTSVAVVREKEAGTMEQLLGAPVTPRQVIAGKVIPYVGLAFIDGLLVIAFAVLHFRVPFEGSLLLLVFFGVLYIVAALSIGVLISTLVNTQLVAMLAALIITVLPSVMLSGFIFEIKNMPLALQYFTEIIPARHFVTIIRGVMLKGAGLGLLWQQAVALVLITAVLLGVAVKRFKLKLG